MGRYLSFASLFFLFLIVSCGKEGSFEQAKPSRGSLQNSAGDCMAKTIAGAYAAGQALGDSNYIDVTVDVGQTGRYTIFTDTVNGYSFKGTGNFVSTGAATIRLKGTGTPASAGTDDFIVFYDSSFCSVSITVNSGTGSSGGTASFTLQGNGGSCMTATPSGTYTQGTALTSANKIDIQVNVTKVGSWNVSTSTVAGFSFSGSGTFTATGVQNITLTASGTPTASGNQTFPVTVGSTSCSFSITVAAGSSGGGSNADHFPLTPNSYWTYNDPYSSTPSDTVKRINNSTTVINGNTYRVITENDNSGTPQWEYDIRKTGNDYFENTTVDDYTAVLTYDTPVEGDILFLKEGLTTGTTWFSSVYSGTDSGVVKKLKYVFTCSDANATITVNGKTYTNAYKITWKPQISTDGGATFKDEGLVWVSYYAKGVGLVDMKGTYGSASLEYKLRFYQIF